MQKEEDCIYFGSSPTQWCHSVSPHFEIFCIDHRVWACMHTHWKWQVYSIFLNRKKSRISKCLVHAQSVFSEFGCLDSCKNLKHIRHSQAVSEKYANISILEVSSTSPYFSKLGIFEKLLMFLLWRLVIVISLFFLLLLTWCFFLYTSCVLRGALRF